jgi:hypothetical protein
MEYLFLISSNGTLNMQYNILVSIFFLMVCDFCNFCISSLMAFKFFKLV